MDVLFPAGTAGGFAFLVRHAGNQFEKNASLLLFGRRWTGEPFPFFYSDYGQGRKVRSRRGWFGGQAMMTVKAAVAGKLLCGTTGMELILLSGRRQFSKSPRFEMRFDVLNTAPM